MTKRINTEKAPAAIGPYSQGVAAGNFLFVSGQLPIDPKTGSIDADNVADQARQSLTNLSQILEAAGTSMNTVVKTTVFIQHMSTWNVCREPPHLFRPSWPPGYRTKSFVSKDSFPRRKVVRPA